MDGGILSLGIVAGPVLLALGLAYGLLKWSSRSSSPGLKHARDQATRDIYERK